MGFLKIGVPSLGSLFKGILLFGGLYQGPRVFGNPHKEVDPQVLLDNGFGFRWVFLREISGQFGNRQSD